MWVGVGVRVGVGVGVGGRVEGVGCWWGGGGGGVEWSVNAWPLFNKLESRTCDYLSIKQKITPSLIRI